LGPAGPIGATGTITNPFADPFTFSNASDSSGPAGGALVVSGGLGVGLTLHVGTSINTPIGNITTVNATTVNGTAQFARYADLAEKYLTDRNYPVGTVIMVGGTAEVTEVRDASCYVLGVVSEKPAFGMNKDLEGGTFIALTGRVPVLIEGAVKKGDPVWPYGNGRGCNQSNGNMPFGFALEDGENGLVECIVK
jgi:hypothetical protein